MKIAIRTLAWLIALLVAVQAASIAYALMSVGHLLSAEGGTITANTDVGAAGFALHSTVGMQVIPVLALAVLVLALIHRSRTTIWLSVGLAVAIAVQIYLGMAGDDAPALGWVHGIVAFVIFVLAGITGQSVGARPAVAGATARP